MAKFEEANTRMFKNVFICRKCKSKIKAPNMKIIAKKISCRACACKDFKVKRKK